MWCVACWCLSCPALLQISQAFVGWAIALYILYMVWVFAGDEWHQRGRPKPQLDGQSLKALLTRIASRGAITDTAAGAQGSNSSRNHTATTCCMPLG